MEPAPADIALQMLLSPFLFDVVQHIARFTGWVQQITDLPRVVSPGTDLDLLLSLSDRWQAKVLPSLLLKQVAHEIALM